MAFVKKKNGWHNLALLANFVVILVVEKQNFTYFWCSFLMTVTRLYFLVNSVSTIIYIRLDWDRQTANFASCQKEINSNLPEAVKNFLALAVMISWSFYFGPVLLYVKFIALLCFSLQGLGLVFAETSSVCTCSIHYSRFQITCHCNFLNFVAKFGSSLRSSKVSLASL